MQLSDEELVLKIQAGEISSFEILVKRYQQKLFHFAKNIVLDSQDAEEVVQDSFVACYRTIDRVDLKRKFSTYLYTITKNKAISGLRAHKRVVPLRAEIPIEDDHEDQLIKQELTKLVTTALNSLHGKQKAVLSLFYFENLSYQEISKKLGLPINTVRTHLRRGKKALAKLMPRQTLNYDHY